jgi:hypothetical protein
MLTWDMSHNFAEAPESEVGMQLDVSKEEQDTLIDLVEGRARELHPTIVGVAFIQ